MMPTSSQNFGLNARRHGTRLRPDLWAGFNPPLFILITTDDKMNTPETDSKATDIIGFFSCSTVPASFARKLEHERDEALDQRDAITIRLGQTQEHLIDARKSAEQWRAVAAKYAGCTENECNRLSWEPPWDSLHNA